MGGGGRGVSRSSLQTDYSEYSEYSRIFCLCTATKVDYSEYMTSLIHQPTKVDYSEYVTSLIRLQRHNFTRIPENTVLEENRIFHDEFERSRRNIFFL